APRCAMTSGVAGSCPQAGKTQTTQSINPRKTMPLAPGRCRSGDSGYPGLLLMTGTVRLRGTGTARGAVAKGHCTEHHRQQAARYHRAENPAPTPLVGDPADAGTRDCRTENVSKEPGKTRRGAGGFLRHHVQRMQADDHDRTIDEEA